MGEDNNTITSKYNEAFLQLGRLDEYWRIAEQYALSGKFLKWNFVLDSIWRELYPDAVRTSNKEQDLIKKNRILKKKIKENMNSKLNLYILINKRHEFLRYVQDLSGKGGKYEDVDDTKGL